jgi:dolichyl-diphosphooligosaccharide--protein glycosyltransferase
LGVYPIPLPDFVVTLFKWLVRLAIVYYALSVAYDIRMYALREYGMVIHEFDPWFNYRATGMRQERERRWRDVFSFHSRFVQCLLFYFIMLSINFRACLFSVSCVSGHSVEYLEANGWERFFKWFDYQSWYPLGRPIGTTIYPGMQITAVAIYRYARACQTLI